MYCSNRAAAAARNDEDDDSDDDTDDDDADSGVENADAASAGDNRPIAMGAVLFRA